MSPRRDRASRRRGFTLVELSVSCVLSTLLVYLVAESYMGFTHSASQIVARVELVADADTALARLTDDLRSAVALDSEASGSTSALKIYSPGETDLRIIYTADSTTRLLTREEIAPVPGVETLSYHVAEILLSDEGACDRVSLVSRLPGVTENRKTGATLERQFHIIVAIPTSP